MGKGAQKKEQSPLFWYHYGQQLVSGSLHLSLEVQHTLLRDLQSKVLGQEVLQSSHCKSTLQSQGQPLLVPQSDCDSLDDCPEQA